MLPSPLRPPAATPSTKPRPRPDAGAVPPRSRHPAPEWRSDARREPAAEARAKIVYERLINFCNDPGTKDALQFLMTREITHLKAFMAALESMGKDPLDIGKIPPTPGIVEKYFNDSTGEGDNGDKDARGPWNDAPDVEYVTGPAQPIAEATAAEVTREIHAAVRKPAPKGR